MAENKIGLKTAVIIGVNAMIGAGVLTIPTLLSSIVGPAGILTTVFSIIIVLAIGLSFGRLAQLYSADGWSYNYPAKWAGHKTGIVSAFFYLFGIIVGMGFLAQQAGIWFNRIIPFLSPNILGIIIISILTLLVLAGAKASSWSQYLIVLLVLIPLVLTSIFCWIHFDVKLVSPFIPYGFTSVLNAMPVVLFSLLGFESIASLYSVIEKPKKNVPRAFVYSISIVGIVYLLFFYGVLFAVPANFFAQGINEPISSVFGRFFPNATFLSALIFLGAVFGIMGTIHSMLWSISELFTSVLKQTKSRIIHKLIDKNIWNKKASVIVTSFFMILSAIFIEGGFLITITALFIILSYVLSIILLLFNKSEWNSGHNYITLIGLFGGGILIYFSFMSSVSSFLKLFV